MNNLLDGLFEDTDERFVNSRAALRDEIKEYKANASLRDCISVLQFRKSSFTFYPMLSIVSRLAFTPAATGTEGQRVLIAAGHLRRMRQSSFTGTSYWNYCGGTCGYQQVSW